MLNPYLRPISHHNVKNLNKRAVLDLIRFTPGGISRVELARHLGLTRAAVTSIANDLLSSKIIREADSRSGVNGRPPVILEINPDIGIVAGIDLGATHLTIIVADFSARVLAEEEIPLDISAGPKVCLDEADSLLRTLLAHTGFTLTNLAAVGIGVPGPIVSDLGMVLSPPIMPGWDRFPIRKSLQERWGCMVSLNNDAEIGALGEWASGAGRGEQNLAYIKVGTGVGAGLLINGQIYRGASGSAGEIGHMTIDENGTLCKCGNRGCLEALASGTAIAEKAREAVQNGERTELADFQPPGQITARDIAEMARRGDLISQQILAKSGTYIGIAIASLINLFNPGMVVLGGGVSLVGDFFLQPVRDAVKTRSLPATAQTARITTALLGRRSAALGAIVQALTVALYEIADKKGNNLHVWST